MRAVRAAGCYRRHGTAVVTVVVTLLGAALLARVVPARQAASVEPIGALRQD
jgi:ABC-type lipoprotein release transport system permease subunit